MVDADGPTPAEWSGLGRLLTGPGLVVLAGGPGAGRTTTLRRLAAGFRGPVFTGGGLATLRHLPGMALARAVRARLPERDAPLAAEAVRARVGAGLLVVDDVQHADALSLAVLPLLADVCRVLVAVRTPGGLPPAADRALRAAAVSWTVLPGLDPAAARALARQVAPGIDERALAAVLARAGGNPLAVRVLAGGGPDLDFAEAVAAAVADLARPARTALAALGLLGRPAPATLLGPGVTDLVDAGWASVEAGTVTPAPRYLAEVAAALLPADERAALHRRLGDLLAGLEGARHRAAGGDATGAHRAALRAARAAETVGGRAAALLLAVDTGADAGVAGGLPPDELRLEAAEAALAAGDTASCRRLLAAAGPHQALPSGLRVRSAVLEAEALLQAGAPAEALAAVLPLAPAGVPDRLRAEQARVALLAALAADPTGAGATAATIPAELTGYPAVRVALAALGAQRRLPGWAEDLSAAADAALAGGRPVDAWWSGWLLTEQLLADGRVADASAIAGRYRAAAAGQLAYSWETRFCAAGLWCGALLGAELDAVVRGAVDLLDRTLPAPARGYAVAAGCLALADTGALAPARARLDRVTGSAGSTGSAVEAVDWVDREVAWLDGQPERALAVGSGAETGTLLAGLRAVTTAWARYDTGATSATGSVSSTVYPIRATLSAWHTTAADAGASGAGAAGAGGVGAAGAGGVGAGQPSVVTAFEAAAGLWQGSAVREQVRCLLAAGLAAGDAERAIPVLLAAEKYAEHAGLTVLLGRVHRALRRFAVRRTAADRGQPSALTAREREVLGLVAAGEPTRRIAGQLGISRETVETHVRAGMRKLGARTRTEAATLALAGGSVGTG